MPLSTPSKYRRSKRRSDPPEGAALQQQQQQEMPESVIMAEASVASVTSSKQKRHMEYMLQKALADLPQESRNAVHSLFNMATATQISLEERVNALHKQLLELRTEHKRVCHERNRLMKANQALRDVKTSLDDRVYTLEQETQHSAAAVAKYRHMLDKLNAHNKTLQQAVSSVTGEEGHGVNDVTFSTAENMLERGSTTTANHSVVRGSMQSSVDKFGPDPRRYAL